MKNIFLGISLLSCLCLSAQRYDSVLTQKWASAGWKNEKLDKYEYYTGCREEDQVSHTWNEKDSAWHKKNMLYINYDNDGRIDNLLHREWDTATVTWKPLLRITKAYNQYYEQTGEFSSIIQNGEWKLNERINYYYDQQNFLIQEMLEKRYSEKWYPYQRISYTTDDNGNWVIMLTEKFDTVQNSWHNYTLDSRHYYKNTGRILTDITELWDGTGWQNYRRFINTYSDSGVCMSRIEEQWDASLEQWVSFSGDVYKYADSSGQFLSRAIHQSWDRNENTWKNISQSLYTYSSSCDLLPVKFKSFTVKSQYLDALVKWQTEQEQNTSHYNLQRSVDGINFKTIARINSKKSVSKLSFYYYTDISAINVNNSKIYYRVEEVNENGATSYSETEMITVNYGARNFFVFPNPARHFLRLQINQTMNENTFAIIYDKNGLMQMQYKIATPVLQELNISKLADGTYSIAIVENGVQKFREFFVKY